MYFSVMAKQQKQFTHNRVMEIKELFDENHWMYCPTAANQADLLRRGISSENSTNYTLLLNEPRWLTDKQQWPKWDNNSATATYTECLSNENLDSQGDI